MPVSPAHCLLLAVMSSPHPSCLCPTPSLLHLEENVCVEREPISSWGSRGHRALQPQSPAPHRTCAACCGPLPTPDRGPGPERTQTLLTLLGSPRGLEHLPWVPRRPWRLKSASGRPLSASRLPALGAPMTSGSLAEAELSRWTPVPCLSSGAETASASSRIGACPASAPTAPEMGTLPVGAAGPSSGLKMLPSETAAG